MAREPLPAKSAAARAFNHFNIASFTIAAEDSNAITVTCQLKDAKGRNLTRHAMCRVYLADEADGGSLHGTAPTSTVTFTLSSEILATLVTDKVWDVLTSEEGVFTITIPQTAAPVTYYLVVVMPDGSLAVSNAITFA